AREALHHRGDFRTRRRARRVPRPEARARGRHDVEHPGHPSRGLHGVTETRPGETLDDLRDLSAWQAIASGQARLQLTADTGPTDEAALRLHFDFAGSGGFVVARRPLARKLPAAWALTLRLRGAAPANKLEIKL